MRFQGVVEASLWEFVYAAEVFESLLFLEPCLYWDWESGGTGKVYRCPGYPKGCVGVKKKLVERIP